MLQYEQNGEAKEVAVEDVLSFGTRYAVLAEYEGRFVKVQVVVVGPSRKECQAFIASPGCIDAAIKVAGEKFNRTYALRRAGRSGVPMASEEIREVLKSLNYKAKGSAKDETPPECVLMQDFTLVEAVS